MSILYRSQRIGKNGRPFNMLKFRTLKNGSDNLSFASEEQYTWCGRFLRKTKLDELPQLLNVLKGDLRLVGPRAEEQRTINVIPEDIRKILLSIRPGLTSLSSIHFFDEGNILELTEDKTKLYWEQIKPMKILLDVFYVQNRSWILDLAILYITFKKILWSIIKI